MEEEVKKVDPIEEVLEQPEEKLQDPFELISEKFDKLDSEIITLKRYCKTLAEEIKMWKSNFKLLLEEKE